MPTTTRSRTPRKSGSALECDSGLVGLELEIGPGLPGDERRYAGHDV
jgi:hypothetical protein